MNRLVKTATVVTVVALLVLVGVLAWLLFLPDPAPEYELSESNTELHATLVRAGIEDAVVDVTPDRVLVRYAVPDRMDLNQSLATVAVQSAASEPDTETIVLQVFDDDEPLQQVTVDTGTVVAFRTGEIDAEEFFAAMEVLEHKRDTESTK